MAESVDSTFSAAYRWLSRPFLSFHVNRDPNIRLQDSLRLSNHAHYCDNPAQEGSHYFDDPAQEVVQPQKYINTLTGETSLLKVQSTSLGGRLQPAENWIRVNASGNADPILRLSAWVHGEGHHHTGLVYKPLAWLGAILKAILLSPIFAFILWKDVDSDVSFKRFRWAGALPQPIPNEYPKFLGRCREYPKHARSNLDSSPANLNNHLANEDNQVTPMYISKEQKRLHRPRKLFVKIDDSWVLEDGDRLQKDRPYTFISYAANQFQRTEDTSGRLVLTEEASQRLKQRAEAVTEQNGLDAYWIDLLRAPDQPEATDDVHRFCDVVRGSEQVYVLLAEDKDMGNSLAMFGKRLWCLPECLLAPRHTISVQGGGKSEMISIMQLPARAWTSSYTNDSGDLVEGKGKEEEFRLLAEHFSGLLTLSRLELFSVALGAMRALDFFPFQNGDIAYALMGLLRKRPAMDPTDSEEQALARLCISNDSDRILERTTCILPSRDDNFKGWLTTNDSFGTNLWDIEPLCQIAGICGDEALIVDGCHGISIRWENIPRVRVRTRKTTKSKIILSLLLSSIVWFQLSLGMFLPWLLFWIIIHVLHSLSRLDYNDDLGPIPTYMYILDLGYKSTVIIFLGLSFVAPFCTSLVYGGQTLEVQPCLVGIEGIMPIEKLERMTFGTVSGSGRLEYTASSGALSSRDSQTRTGIAPKIDPETLPAGHRIFTLLDTGNLTVTVFSAPRPPTVALLCGKESGMLRAVLCSYSESRNALRRETVLRMETSMWNRSSEVGWVKLAMS